VWVVDLARIEDPALVPAALAAAMELDATEQTPSMDLVVTALRSKHALLIFDNCEHLSDAAGASWKRCCSKRPGFTCSRPAASRWESSANVFIASRRSRWPPDEKPITAEEALAYDGVRFFVTRAEEAAGFVLEDRDADTVVHIARRLDGIPLAIELATARLRARRCSNSPNASMQVFACSRAVAARPFRANKHCAR